MKTIEGFIEFINEQAPERKIYHGGWCDCAVGDYIVDGGIHAASDFAEGCLWDFRALYLALVYPEVAFELLPDYRHLQQWLKDNPQSLEDNK